MDSVRRLDRLRRHPEDHDLARRELRPETRARRRHRHPRDAADLATWQAHSGRGHRDDDVRRHDDHRPGQREEELAGVRLGHVQPAASSRAGTLCAAVANNRQSPRPNA